MTPPVETTRRLIAALALEAGAPARGAPSAGTFAGAAVLALPLSVLLVMAVAGIRDDLPGSAGGAALAAKAGLMVLLACGGLLAVRAAATPDRTIRPLVVFGPAAVLGAAWLLLDTSGLPAGGADPPLSALSCVGAIILAAVPPAAALLALLRRGLPTRPRAAGFFAGLSGGALGGLAYSLACVNDAAGFVCLWYAAAALVAGGVGAALGPRLLRW